MTAKLTWVTGASSGIGEALVKELCRRGRTVAASARSADKLEALARDTGGRAHPVPLDVTDGAAARATFTRIESELGEVGAAVFAAGNHQPVDARDFKAAELQKLVAVNLMGVANCLEPAMAAMIGRQRGRLAIVSSIAGYRGLPTAAYYGATKAALINMTEALRFDLVKHGVTIQLIDPGFVRTPLTDKNEFGMPFLMEPDDAARQLADGIESDRFEITFPKRLTWTFKRLRCMPYAVYFPLMSKATGR